MDFIIYHSKDLDGKASGAIAGLFFQKDNPKLIGYHYNEPLDLKQFENKDVLMVDVTLSVESIIQLAQTTKSFTLVDHHVSFYDNLKIYCNENINLDSREFTGLVENITYANMNYYYSPKLSACEIMLQLFTVGNEFTQRNIKLLGQYDTWRDTDAKKFTTDVTWPLVLNHQYGFRLADTISEVQLFLMADCTQHIEAGCNIMKYQSDINKTAMKRSFEFLLNGYNILACESVQFNSNSFESAYNPEFHDAMMPFNYDGQTRMWNFSLYTTKPEVDILSIAKQYGGGGHKQACGFQLPNNKVNFIENGIQLGEPFVVEKETVIQDDNKIVPERDTYQPPPPPEPIEEKIIPGLNDDNDLDGIGTAKEEPKPEVKPKVKRNGAGKK